MPAAESFDVLVIGSGASGLAAAVSAAGAGARVGLATKGSLQELGVRFTRDNGGYRLARCGGASRRRLLQVGDRTGHAITTALRERVEASSVQTFPKAPLAALDPTESGWRARCG